MPQRVTSLTKMKYRPPWRGGGFPTTKVSIWSSFIKQVLT
jgi:hypothetical protein